MKNLLFLLLSGIGQLAIAQTEPVIAPDEIVMPAPQEEMPDQAEVFVVVDEMPGFPGGEEELFAFIRSNVHYPDPALQARISGKVYVNFVVETDGTITRVKVLRGMGHGCDEEPLRVVNLMPPWKPGTQNGKPVRVRYNLPFSFHLN